MANSETKHEARMRLAPVFENPENEGAWHVGFAAGFDAGYRAGDWRRVDKELPENFGVYLATIEDPDERIVIPVWFDRAYMEFTTNDAHRQNPGKVIAWKELGTPYTEEGQP